MPSPDDSSPAAAQRRRRRDPSSRTLTASEAAAILGVSVATVRGWADQGRLPSHRTVGGHRRFELEQLREWLSERGAPVRQRVNRSAGADVPPAPGLARELNNRTDAIIERVLAGYSDSVSTPLAPPSPAAARRAVSRFVRMISAGLEAGDAGVTAGRAELVGFRGGVEGEGGARVVMEHTRYATATLQEGEDAIAEGHADDERSTAAMYAVVDHLLAAVVRGYRDALDSV